MVDHKDVRTDVSAHRLSRPVVVAAAVAVAVVANLVLYAVGRAAGGSFEFTAAEQLTEVGAVTVAGFSAVPLGVGLVVVALLARHRWVTTTAAVVAPLLAVVTIVVMTVPADLDTVSTLTLAGCHLTLAPISFLAVRALRR
ncbi:DUF6069 family protein [Jannaschia sp. R86511]|uniref:DUF6069 family protein n=1 Tax=Jannaschia sp. R86511 TaxID=3093853 RepID=UPI0036D22567